MVVGILEVRLAVYASRSLKDKRRVTRSLKDRIGGRHNVSIAEVDDLDHRQAITLGMAMVANDGRFVRSALARIVDELRVHPDASLVDFDIELV
jgi:uncharacterized protein YlxP (DUF503 family)